MNAIKYLFAAYIVTWLVHGIYLGSLVRRFSRLRRELAEVHKSRPRDSNSGRESRRMSH
jgi:CcmD family protein